VHSPEEIKQDFAGKRVLDFAYDSGLREAAVPEGNSAAGRVSRSVSFLAADMIGHVIKRTPETVCQTRPQPSEETSPGSTSQAVARPAARITNFLLFFTLISLLLDSPVVRTCTYAQGARPGGVDGEIASCIKA